MREYSGGQIRIPDQPMKVVSEHCPQDGVMVPAISGILEHLPGSGLPRREVITPGYGSWIIILPGYIAAPMVSLKAFLSAASRVIILHLNRHPQDRSQF